MDLRTRTSKFFLALILLLGISCSAQSSATESAPPIKFHTIAHTDDGGDLGSIKVLTFTYKGYIRVCFLYETDYAYDNSSSGFTCEVR